MNSVGISAVIGVALILSVGGFKAATRDRWQTFRLFAMPFCVSSFSSLIKGKGFILVFLPSLPEMATAVGLCAAFAVIVIGLRRARSVARAGAFFGSPKDSIGTKQPLLAKSAKTRVLSVQIVRKDFLPAWQADSVTIIFRRV